MPSSVVRQDRDDARRRPRRHPRQPARPGGGAGRAGRRRCRPGGAARRHRARSDARPSRWTCSRRWGSARSGCTATASARSSRRTTATSVPGPNGDVRRATAALLEPRHRDLLDGLPLTVTLDVDGLGPVLFCHATPRRDDEFVLVDSPLAVWSRALAGVERVTGGDGAHAHAVRPAGRRPAGGQPGQRRDVLRRARCLLGAARTGHHAAVHGVRRGAGRRADPVRWAPGRGGLGAASTSSAQYGDAEALAAFTDLVDPWGPTDS